MATKSNYAETRNWDKPISLEILYYIKPFFIASYTMMTGIFANHNITFVQPHNIFQIGARKIPSEYSATNLTTCITLLRDYKWCYFTVLSFQVAFCFSILIALVAPSFALVAGAQMLIKPLKMFKVRFILFSIVPKIFSSHSDFFRIAIPLYISKSTCTSLFVALKL